MPNSNPAREHVDSLEEQYATLEQKLSDEQLLLMRAENRIEELIEQYEDAQRKLSCGYDTGTGTNCGECLDCLKVNWHFTQEAVGNLKEQLETLRGVEAEYAHLLARFIELEEQLEALYEAVSLLPRPDLRSGSPYADGVRNRDLGIVWNAMDRFEERHGKDAANNPISWVWCRQCGTIRQRPEHCPAKELDA